MLVLEACGHVGPSADLGSLGEAGDTLVLLSGGSPLYPV